MRREGRRRAPSLSWGPCRESEAFALRVAMETVSPKEVHMTRNRIVALLHLNFCLSSRERVRSLPGRDGIKVSLGSTEVIGLSLTPKSVNDLH